MEGYTARDALIVMRLDLSEWLQELQQEIAELHETLEFSGIAEQLLRDDDSLTELGPIKRWLETVSNRTELQHDLEDLMAERDEIQDALDHLEERLTGKRLP